jgi:hypothetical protein
MSYSFAVKAADKARAKQKAEAKFDEVIAGQPIHSKDRAAALSLVDALIALLPDAREDQTVVVTVNGSLGWASDDQEKIHSASAGSFVSILDERYLGEA